MTLSKSKTLEVMSMSIETDDQVLWGLTEIAAAINRNEAQTLSLIRRKYLDVGKVGHFVVTTRGRLMKPFLTCVAIKKPPYLARLEQVKAEEAA